MHEEAYWFGPVRLSVGLSIRLSVTLALGQEPLEILKFGMWVEYANFFLVHRFCHCRVMPFLNFFHFHYIVSLRKLVNKISQEPLEPGSLYLNHRLCLKCR